MVKKLKVTAPDVRALLASTKTPQLAGRLAGRAGAVDDHCAVLDDVDEDEDVVVRAAEVLFALGHGERVVHAWCGIAGDADDSDDAFVVGAIGDVVGDRADPVVVAPLLFAALDEQPSRWKLLLEPLVRFGGRGFRDERSWSWLERLRRDEPGLWCCLVDGYGDARAVPLLQALVDDAADDDEAAALVLLEAVEALRSLDALRPGDDARQRRAQDALRRGRSRAA
jgi:hypothetical protein